jgi:xylulose-5-phosphate/fructose-6-phosphate phosphoketolase
VTNRESTAEIIPIDDHVAPDGRVMEVLSEHMCQGWLEGYLLTGRHGFFSCYEAFVHIIDSMFNQHAKWLKVTREDSLAAAHRVAELSAHLARLAAGSQRLQPSGPGFIDHVVNKKAEIVRVYLPPDANTLLSVTDHCLRSRNYVNVIVAGKQPAPQWLTMDERFAIAPPASASGSSPATTKARARRRDGLRGRYSTLETLAAVDWLRRIPDLKIRVVNVVDLMTLQPPANIRTACRQGIRFAVHHDKPIIFNFTAIPG